MKFSNTTFMFFSFIIHMILMNNLVFVISTTSSSSDDDDDHTSLIYRGCGNQGSFDSTTLKPFLDTISKQSSVKKFSTATDSNLLTALFQCRGDLTNQQCHNCVLQAEQMAITLCGQSSSAARIQFKGCYVIYSVSGMTLSYGSELLYKKCSGTNVAGVGFEERRDMALQTMSEQVSKSNGFYMTDFESVYVMGQCEGEVVDSECSECVKTAVQKAQVECGSSVAGEAYLDKCFVSYSYSPNGVPSTVVGSGSNGE